MLKPEISPKTQRTAAEPCASVRFSLKSGLAGVASVSKETESFLLSHGVAGSLALNIRLAIAEACNNAIQYGRQGTTPELEVRLRGHDFLATVTDHSEGFPLPETSKAPDIQAEGGRGLFLIRQIMDSVEYFPDPNGNRLFMRKTLSPPEPPK